MSILYYLVIKPISLLPYFILYGISDIFYYLFYYIIRYRKKVILDNLQRSFPDKSQSEIKALSKKFYRHFMDLVIESIKCFSITPPQIEARMKTLNPELPNTYFEKGQSILIVGGHYNNWEMYAMMVDKDIKHKTYALYSPLSNKYFDEKMKKSRGKYGLKMVSTKLANKLFTDNTNDHSAYIFGSDQSPSNPKKCYWLKFLNQDTGVLFGVEKFAKDFDLPVIYGSIRKIKRGYYEVSYQLVTDQPKENRHGEITEKHTKLLEQDILKKPEYWLWTHRRWKNKKPVSND